MLLYAIRYFVVVSVVPRLFVAGFVVSVAAATVRLTANPSTVVDVLTPVLLLQLFVASSGFQYPARRGYYDLLLTSGTPRWQIAIAHCVVSITPGLASWVAVGLLELAASQGAYRNAFAAGTCAAFIGSSLAAWGTAVYSARTAAAIYWLLIMTIPPIARVASPLRLLGVPVSDGHASLILGGFVIGILPLCAGVWTILRGATPLEGAQ